MTDNAAAHRQPFSKIDVVSQDIEGFLREAAKAMNLDVSNSKEVEFRMAQTTSPDGSMRWAIDGQPVVGLRRVKKDDGVVYLLEKYEIVMPKVKLVTDLTNMNLLQTMKPGGNA